MKQQFESTTKRGEEWSKFAAEVLAHIETTTIVQYGDAPDDLATEYSAEDCVRQIAKYAARYGRCSGDRGGYQDMLKIAHYAAMAAAKKINQS